MRSALVAVLIAALAASASSAQQMPDPAQMAGQPLPAPELATGMVSVRVVRERMGNNVTNHPVTLAGPGQRLDANTDAQGRATFGDVPPGTRVVVQTVVDGETLQSQPFTIPASGGIRIALIAGLEAAAARERVERDAAAQQPARQGVVVFGGESRVILEFQDDNLQVFYLLDIVNNARTPIDIGEPMFIVLPEAATGAGALQGSSTLATVQADRIRVNGPFPPGITQVQVGYRLPYSGDTTVLTQQWPAAFEQVFVAAEKVGDLKIASPQFQQQQEASAGGAPFLMATGGRINAGDSLTLTLTGLPHRNTIVRDVGVAVGVLILIAGFWVALTGPRARNTRLEDLKRRKDKLFADLVALEEDHRHQRIDDRRFAARRQTLVAQLERVMGELDRSGGEGVAA
jgi:hypothetical protein